MKKKRKQGKVLFICFCIALLSVVVYQIKEPRIESIAEALFIIAGCTLSYYMCYGIGVLFFGGVNNQGKNEGCGNISDRHEPRRIVSAAIVDVQYKTKVKTNYPKAIVMSMLGQHAYGRVGGILGAASGSRMKTIPKKVLFTVVYSDGTQRSEKVSYGSMRYRTLMQYMEESW